MFIKVDLPAPFSPKIAWIWPVSTFKLIESLAVNAPNVFVIPRNSNDIFESYRLIVQKTGGPIARSPLF